MRLFRFLFKLCFLLLVLVGFAYLFLAIFYFGSLNPFELAQPMDVFNRFFSKEALDNISSNNGATATAQISSLLQLLEGSSNGLDNRFPTEKSAFYAIPGYVDFLKNAKLPGFVEQFTPYLTKYVIPLGMAFVSGLIGTLIVNFFLNKITRSIKRRKRNMKKQEQEEYYDDSRSRRKRN
ncbi:hypothetical protein V4Q74_01970 [Mycoplasmoides genitalium]|uniref:MG319/MPN454 family protein n=1 Tax=Mycoplasmoides genitalium TaxID=2097 RepID=UPI002FCE294D